jgi:hypothetical protein
MGGIIEAGHLKLWHSQTDGPLSAKVPISYQKSKLLLESEQIEYRLWRSAEFRS